MEKRRNKKIFFKGKKLKIKGELRLDENIWDEFYLLLFWKMIR